MPTFVVMLTEPEPSEYKHLGKDARASFLVRHNDDIRKRLVSWVNAQGLDRHISKISRAGTVPALTIECKNMKIASRLKQVDGVESVVKDPPLEHDELIM